MLRLLTGVVFLLSYGGVAMAELSAAPVPVPVSKPFIVKTTPFETPPEPTSFSHKMIIVLPESKPFVAQAKPEEPAKNINLEDVLSSVIKDTTTGYILPPALPEWKRLAANPSVPSGDVQTVIAGSETIITAGGIPVPGHKPVTRSVSAINPDQYVSISEMATVKARNKEIDDRQAGARAPSPPQIIYQAEGDERAASRAVPSAGRSASIERTPAVKIGKLKETNAASPFKSKKAQKAAKQTGNDPIVLFFQENSPELEVGQIDILKEDVIEALKHQPGRQATVYGIAAPDRNNPELSRQLAVSRAMMVREYIIDKRISGDRISVQTVINDDQMMPKDRVDIIIR